MKQSDSAILRQADVHRIQDLLMGDTGLRLHSWMEEGSCVMSARQSLREHPTAAFQLELRQGGRRLGRNVYRKESVRLGRSPDADVILDDPAVSRFHAAVESVGFGVYRLKDLGSRNGVRVNGRKVRGWQLSEGDRIGIGEFELIFSCDARGLTSKTPRATRRPTPASTADEAFGRTINVDPKQADPELRERSIPFRAYLRPVGDTKRVAVKISQHVLQRDVFVIGGGQDADLRLTGWMVPRVCAVIIRGYGGFSVQAVAGWPFVTRVNRGKVQRQRMLEDGDELCVAGQSFTFHLAYV